MHIIHYDIENNETGTLIDSVETKTEMLERVARFEANGSIVRVCAISTDDEGNYESDVIHVTGE